MLDTFKDYANDVSYKAILADSGMMIMACLIGSYLANKNTNTMRKRYVNINIT